MNYLFKNISFKNKKKLLCNINIITKKYSKNECIFHENDTCNYITFIISGDILVKNFLSDGREVILRILNESESFGEGLIFSEKPRYHGSFIAKTDTIINLISKNDLIYLMKSNYKISLNILNKLNMASYKQMTHIRLLNLKKVSSKIAFFFYLKYEDYGREFLISLNKTQIAQYLNIERPTFSKELNCLINEKILAYNKKKYTILDIDSLIKRI